MKLRLYLTGLLMAAALSSEAQTATPVAQMEKLNRGVVALPSSTGFGCFVSWRFLGTDSEDTRFDLLRDGTAVATDLMVTNYDDWSLDWDGSVTPEYQVVVKVGDEVIETTEPVKPWTYMYKQLKLNRPATGAAAGGTYSPNDCSVGDVDGDGEYEIFVKWDPSTSKDNSNSGVTDNVYIDCYKLDGTHLWRIDLGRNIRAGAHYTQFQVYDYDGDGRAELMCKTAPGSLDGQGNYVSQAATDSRIRAASDTKSHVSTDGAGRINSGYEYLTVFEGLTGKAVHTIPYYPNRNAKAELSDAAGSFNWDDRSNKTDKGSYGNRGERYLAATAYLDGPYQNPCGIFCRGYYTYAYIWAVGFDGKELKTKWLHSSDTKTTYKVMDADGKTSSYKGTICTSGLGRYTMYANGNHNLSIADVDGDGKDEVIWGSAALDDDGKMLYSVGFGHGDAMHLADLDPDRPGLELFDVHEEKGTYAWDIHDAATGEIIYKSGQSGADNGRGVAADIVADNRGYEFWSAYGGFDSGSRNKNPFNVQTGQQAGPKAPSMNFRIYWDGDPQDELLDGTSISKYNAKTGEMTEQRVGSYTIPNLGRSSSCNGTKATPNLSADIFGDWREELILWDTRDNASLNIYTTIIPTEYRVPTLMHDHTYRMGVCWQNSGYNQPPHLGYYLPDYLDGKITITGIQTVRSSGAEAQQFYDLRGRRMPVLQKGLNIIREGGKVRKVFVK